MRTIICFLLFVVCIGCRNKRSSNVVFTTPATTSYAGAVEVGFEASGWRFSWETRKGGGIPVDAFLGLCATRGGSAFFVDKPDDMSKLQGVKVLSAKQALAFVRLFTKEDTYYRFCEPFAFEWFVNKAQVVEKTNAFVVTRHLVYPRDSAIAPIDVQMAGGGFPVYQVKEIVSPDGHYSCERLGLIDWVKERDIDIQRIQ